MRCAARAIRLVGVRHEQAAAYAADGYARATGRLGVALTTTGPGAANTLGAVGEAWASRTPILVIATDIPSTLRREGVYRGVLHETAGQADMFRPVTAARIVVRSAGELGAASAPDRCARTGGPSISRSRPTCCRRGQPARATAGAAAEATQPGPATRSSRRPSGR